jgi:hypothetical protein
MFNSKKTQLIEPKANEKASVTTTNGFINAGLKEAAKTKSGNGALKFDSTGNPFVDQFGKLGSYKEPRTYGDIAMDTSTLWGINPYLTVCFIFFLRMITRVVSLFDGTKTTTVQRGAGLKHESIMRMMWLHVNHPNVFWKNIQLFISAGSWKDIIQMLSYDLQYNGWENRILNWNNMGILILAGLENPNTINLLKKYLPTIRTNSKAKTLEAQADNIIAKWICSLLFGAKTEGKEYANYKKYRNFKSSSNAFQWQQLISQGKHSLVNFDTIHGRALDKLIKGKYITNQNLTARYEAWIDTKPIAKYTGYPHELFAKLPKLPYQIKTLNAQFMGLVETASKNAVDNTTFVVVRDTSASMKSIATGTKQSCYDIGKALALFFSYMLPKGAFADSWIEFNSTAKMHIWKGETPYERWTNDRSGYVGSTNFQSVIDLFISIKKKGVDESEFATGILCISDSEFNPSDSLKKTNVQNALDKLRKAGFSEQYVSKFKIVLWNLQSKFYGKGTGEKFETYGDVDGIYYFSGFDASIISFLTGTEEQQQVPKNASEVLDNALSQEIMRLIEI